MREFLVCLCVRSSRAGITKKNKKMFITAAGACLCTSHIPHTISIYTKCCCCCGCSAMRYDMRTRSAREARKSRNLFISYCAPPISACVCVCVSSCCLGRMRALFGWAPPPPTYSAAWAHERAFYTARIFTMRMLYGLLLDHPTCGGQIASARFVI